MPEYPARHEHFTSPDGLGIFYRRYQATDERARLVIAHGLGEHSGRYGTVAGRLLSRGISIWAPDHRGHGRSDGPRGHVSSFYQYVDDLHTMVALAREHLPEGMKIFLLGHSMGGLIALRFAVRFPGVIDGLIISSPALGVPQKPSPILNGIARILSLLRPTFSFSNGLDASKISHDEAVVRAYLDDPLVHTRVSARWFTEFIAAMEAANRTVPEMKTPILMQIAGDDYLTSASASKRFFDAITVADKTFCLYEGFYHEVYNEKEQRRVRVLDDLESWFMGHI